MTLKTAIKIIENANQIFLTLLFVCIFLLVAKSGDEKFLVFEILIFVPFLFTYFFRMALINLYLKKCKYPVVFLAVLNKLNLAQEFEIKWSEDAQKDIDTPTYSTELFLADNKLVNNANTKLDLETYTKHNRQNVKPTVRFTAIGLHINQSILSWKDIFDWNYEFGSKHNPGKIILYYYDFEKNIFEIPINLSAINCDKVDFLLLITHYKAKYD